MKTEQEIRDRIKRYEEGIRAAAILSAYNEDRVVRLCKSKIRVLKWVLGEDND